jgi:hypothetical protein
MQQVEGSNPFSRFVKACDLQAFFVAPVGKCVCIGVAPSWTGDGRTIGSLPKGRPFAGISLGLEPLTFCRCAEGREFDSPNVAQPPVPCDQPQCRASNLHGCPSGTSRCADATVQTVALMGIADLGLYFGSGSRSSSRASASSLAPDVLASWPRPLSVWAGERRVASRRYTKVAVTPEVSLAWAVSNHRRTTRESQRLR